MYACVCACVCVYMCVCILQNGKVKTYHLILGFLFMIKYFLEENINQLFLLSQGFLGLTPGPLSHNSLNGKSKARLSTIAPYHCFSLKFLKKTSEIMIIVRICLCFLNIVQMQNKGFKAWAIINTGRMWHNSDKFS